MIDIILEDDDIESLEELRKIILEETESPDMFVGVFNIEPNYKNYPINSFHRREGKIYINTKTGWKIFLEDGIDGQDGKQIRVGGGGLGYNDVVKTISDSEILGSKVNVGLGYTNSNSSNLNTLLHDFDNLITSGGSGGTFTGTIDASAVNVSGSYINTSANTLDGVISDFDSVISRKILLGEYKTNDMFEEDYIYVGYASLSGSWYVKRVEENGDNIYLRYANVSNNPSMTSYISAINNRATLTYDVIQNLTF